MNAFIQQGIYKDIYNGTKISISNKFCSFELSIIYTSNNPGKKLLCMFSTLIILRNFLSIKSAFILKGFLKDHVTLKTEVMTDENSALPSHE